MNRITGDEVTEAFRAIGKRPIRGQCVSGGSCCALMALAYNKFGEYVVGILPAMKSIKNLGFSESYAVGVMQGWDGIEYGVEQEMTDEFSRGFSDGKTAWQSCLSANLIRE